MLGAALQQGDGPEPVQNPTPNNFAPPPTSPNHQTPANSTALPAAETPVPRTYSPLAPIDLNYYHYFPNATSLIPEPGVVLPLNPSYDDYRMTLRQCAATIYFSPSIAFPFRLWRHDGRPYLQLNDLTILSIIEVLDSNNHPVAGTRASQATPSSIATIWSAFGGAALSGYEPVCTAFARFFPHWLLNPQATAAQPDLLQHTISREDQAVLGPYLNALPLSSYPLTVISRHFPSIGPPVLPHSVPNILVPVAECAGFYGFGTVHKYEAWREDIEVDESHIGEYRGIYLSELRRCTALRTGIVLPPADWE